MTFSLHVTSVDVKLIDKAAVHRAMAGRYLDIVQGTFGANGQNRPTVWSPLSPAYAKRVKPPVPTLFRKGTLFQSLRVTFSEAQGTVWTDSPIAEFHQFGTSKMPARPFFPFYRDGSPTQFAVDEVTKAASSAIARKQRR